MKKFLYTLFLSIGHKIREDMFKVAYTIKCNDCGKRYGYFFRLW